MGLSAFIGAQLAVGIPGIEVSNEVIAHLRRTHAQSLVMFRRNIVSSEQFVRLIHQLEEALERRLLILIDHEGGRIMRFPEGVTHFPDAMTQGRVQDEKAAERQGAIEAEELRRLGVHVNLAPCVDVIVEGANPVIGDRSYGSDPLRVGTLAAARIRGLQSNGVGACAKHFPGLGAVPKDPHRVLPTIWLDWKTMERTHLPPFRAAIAAGVSSVMSSHVCYPMLGEPPEFPATFSSRLIRRLLREQMEFPGVMMTDALEMGALRAFGKIGEAAVRATEAGHDLLLICSEDLSQASEVFSALKRAYEAGQLRRHQLEASLERLSRFRQQFLSQPLKDHV